MALTKEQLDAINKKYGKSILPSQISTTPSIISNDEINLEIARMDNLRIKNKNEKKENFFQRVKGRFGERFEQAIQIETETQPMVESAFQVLGTAAGGVTDVIFEGIKSLAFGVSRITPDIIEEPIRKKFREETTKLLESSVGQTGLRALSQGISYYQEWKRNNSRVAKNLESLINIGDLLLLARGSAIVKQTKIGLKTTREILEESAERGIKKSQESFLRKLVRPTQTTKIKEAQVFRTTETGFGPFRTSIIAPTPQNLATERTLLKIPNLKAYYTDQRNFNIIQDANIKAAINLEDALKRNDFIFPKQELIAKLNQTKQTLADNPFITGDPEKSADKLLIKVFQLIDKSEAKGSNLLQVRKDFDAWVKKQKGSNIFESDRDSAISIANREVRQSINEFLDEKAIGVEVKKSLRKQSNLYNALDNIAPKAGIEADTAFGRTLQKLGQVLGTKSRIVQGIAAAVGIGGLGAAATFAPVVAVTGGLGLLIWKSGKLILNPKFRKVIARIIKETEKIIPGIKDDAILPLLNADIVILRQLLEEGYK